MHTNDREDSSMALCELKETQNYVCFGKHIRVNSCITHKKRTNFSKVGKKKKASLLEGCAFVSSYDVLPVLAWAFLLL